MDVVDLEKGFRARSGYGPIGPPDRYSSAATLYGAAAAGALFDYGRVAASNFYESVVSGGVAQGIAVAGAAAGGSWLLRKRKRNKEQKLIEPPRRKKKTESIADGKLPVPIEYTKFGYKYRKRHLSKMPLRRRRRRVRSRVRKRVRYGRRFRVGRKRFRGRRIKRYRVPKYMKTLEKATLPRKFTIGGHFSYTAASINGYSNAFLTCPDQYQHTTSINDELGKLVPDSAYPSVTNQWFGIEIPSYQSWWFSNVYEFSPEQLHYIWGPRHYKFGVTNTASLDVNVSIYWLKPRDNWYFNENITADVEQFDYSRRQCTDWNSLLFNMLKTDNIIPAGATAPELQNYLPYDWTPFLSYTLCSYFKVVGKKVMKLRPGQCVEMEKTAVRHRWLSQRTMLSDNLLSIN